MHLESVIHPYYDGESMPNRESWEDLVCWS